MQTYGYTIPAGGSQLIHRPGTYIRGLEGAQGYQIQLEDGPATGFETGLAYHAPEPFGFVRITNTAASAQYIEVAISDGEVSDNRLVGGAIAPKPGDLIQAVATLDGGGTIAANQDRRELVMVADVANGAAVTIAGLPIQPGDTFTLPVTNAVTVTATAGDKLYVAEVV